ncbi:helix-turn-helix domain-containing protein [Hymenobacter guriensis]|uniref:Helix-turn-helix transcriptional regulator n=1 Tax=Hymenobacter guriensis TaxID=2793065 RepID=A0ABS0L0P9_9BACT|nr:helix-turn-helix transcriptional regulator [Hymenobacter guriensis]MBG8553638.1 helix-turn-helix transcriptional regulator [Hymenobacter guriensis]
MPRSPKYTNSLLSQIRAYYGLSQHALAEYLGIALSQVSHLEAGRRQPSLAVLDALAPLTQHMTAPQAPPDPDATPPAGPLDAAPLEARRRHCRWRAANLRRELEPLAAQATVAARWAGALPGLLAGLPPADPLTPPAPDASPAGRAAYQQWFRRVWLEAQAPALSPEALAH